jgi:hypothetical protein
MKKKYTLTVNCLTYGSIYDQTIKNIVRFFINLNPNMGKLTGVGDEYHIASILCELSVKESEYVRTVTAEQVEHAFRVVPVTLRKRKGLIKSYLK